MQTHPTWGGAPRARLSSGLDYARIRSGFFLLFRKGKQARGDCVWEAWRGASRVQVTWGDEEGPPQLLVPRHIPDLLGHVDHPASHGGDPAEVQDPGGKVTGKGLNVCAPARARLAWNEYPSLRSEAGSPTPWTLGTEPGDRPCPWRAHGSGHHHNDTTSVLQRNGYQQALWAHRASVSPPLHNGAHDSPPPAGCWGRARPLAALRPGVQGAGSPVQVEGSDLCVVPLVVREIKEVRRCLLLPRLPRENGMKQRVYHRLDPPGKGRGWLAPAAELGCQTSKSP